MTPESPDAEFEDVPPARRPRRLGDLVGRYVQRAVGVDVPAARDIFTHWAEFVGEQVAPHVTPVRLEKRVLTVEVVDNAWATQMTFLESQLLTTLREHAGDVVDAINVRVRRAR